MQNLPYVRYRNMNFHRKPYTMQLNTIYKLKCIILEYGAEPKEKISYVELRCSTKHGDDTTLTL